MRRVTKKRPIVRTPAPDETTLTASDLCRDVLRDLLVRPSRTLMTALGTLVGVAVLVGTLGLASSMESAVQERFDAISPREVTVTPKAEAEIAEQQLTPLPPDSPSRAARIDGVVAAGTLTELTGTKRIRAAGAHNPTAAEINTVSVVAVSPGALESVGATMRGAPLDERHNDRADDVAVLGRDIARQLGVDDIRGRPVIMVDDRPLAVIGIIDSLERRSNLLNSVLVTEGLASAQWGLRGPATLLVVTRPGAANRVAEQVSVAVLPTAPEQLTVSVPPTAEATREGVSSDTRGLLLGLSAVSLLVGGIGIANVTLVAVIQRTAEIGLRRALGARRRDVLAHFLLISTATGALGAVLGTCAGVWLTIGVSLLQHWPATLDRWVLLAGPLVGSAIGLVAGIYPAWRAASIEPVAALRTGL